ncbi:MAG: TonB-dependent receptor [Gammaproteobacteria bacterium]|nr:TonB-dependent receptor [Gammaproteobacteria bacterium]MDH4312006.1 TonB-dependent receptor [Gammaproteobacteria bacterium]MDH5310262.1 TonB-dependent receptor [Gammaproteobacteria bacterium]
MKKSNGPAWLAITTGALGIAALPTTASAQQAGANEQVEEIVTIGTRRAGRTALDTAVPIDVFGQEDLDSVSSSDLIDVVRTLVPSFNVSREPINDGATFVRPPTLRGLDSDKTLVLVNGKRRHRAALVRLGGFGAHGPDLATIPSISLKSVEVLRDGASALYGSDAIAGVMNFNLKDAAEGGELQVQYGEYSEGGEQDHRVGLNFGLPLGQKGFVNISAEWSEAEGTSRGGLYDISIRQSGQLPSEARLNNAVQTIVDINGDPLRTEQRYGPDAHTEVYAADGTLITITNDSDGIYDDRDTRYADNWCNIEVGYLECKEQIWGMPRADAIRSFVNAGYDLSSTTQLYGWFNYSDSDSDGSFFHRRPGVSQLLLIRQPDGEIWDPRDKYPSGFTPRFGGNVIDYSFTGGIRGEWGNGFNYDFSGRSGHSEIIYRMWNTMNPSMGPGTPTRFHPGDLVTEENALNADFSKAFDIGLANEMNFAFGFEFREESYELVEGDEPSYRVGPYAAQDPWNFEITAAEVTAGDNDNWLGAGLVAGCYIPGLEGTGFFGPGTSCPAGDPIYSAKPVGSNGFPGYPPSFTGKYERDSWAAYADFETDLTDSFLVNAAFRYEDFSDFGDNFSWKLAARWRISEAFTVRASAGTGFRAPTPGQISTVNVSTRIASDGTPVAEGIFPPDSPVSAIFGAQPLKDETSTQYTLGLTSTPTENLTLTLDYYFIELEDRIVLSSDYVVTPEIAAQLEALGVPGANTIAQVSFFANDVTSETSGVDLVATYSTDWSAGSTTISASANWNDTKITQAGQFLDAEDVFNAENFDPSYRLNLTARHTWANNITFTLRGNFYGDHEQGSLGDTLATEKYGALSQWDTDLTWDINDKYRVTIGGNNILDEYPDRDTLVACCGQIYVDSRADWMGAYYYLRGTINWD